MSFEIKFKTLEELKTELKGNNYCHTSEEARKGMVTFCEIHPEVEFVEASLEGWSGYQWEYSSSLIFKYTFYGDTLPTIIEAHWCQLGNSDNYWFEFDIDDVEYYPACQYKNYNWYKV